MDFGTLPPEIISSRMCSGPGSGPMLAAAAAWEGLVDGLYSLAAAVTSAIRGLTRDAWQGPSATAVARAANVYVDWIARTATQAVQVAVQAKVAAAAYEVARTMTVPPPMITANRKLFRSLVRINELGTLTHAIAAAEARYNQMWAQNAAAMYGYASSSATATELQPFTTPSVEVPAALAGEPAGTSAPTTLLPLFATDPQWYATVPATLRQLASPTPSSPASPQWIDDSLGDPAGGQMSAISALLAKLTAVDRKHSRTGESTRARGRPVSVRAWFSGGPAAEASRLGARVGWGEAQLPAEIGPCAMIGNLSVPQTWAVNAPMSPGVGEAVAGHSKQHQTPRGDRREA